MISDVFIIGLGQIGGSLALAFRKHGLAGKIYGYDLKVTSEKRKILDEFVDLSAGIDKAEAIFLCVPVTEIMKLVREIGPVLRPDQVVLDTGSTKRAVVAEMSRFPKANFIGGHPMTGSVKKEASAWNPDLFQNKPFFLCLPDPSKSAKLKEVEEIVRKLGAFPVEISAAEHDLLAALTSHFPYLISLALFSIYLEKRGLDEKVDVFISSGFLGASRLVLTSKEMGRDLLMTNKDNIKNVGNLMKKKIDELILCIEDGSIGTVLDVLNAEAEKRRGWYEHAGF